MRVKLLRVVAAWLAVFAAFMGFAVGMAPAAHADTGVDEALFLTLTNTARAAQGLQPLATDGQLTSIARQWSTHMAAAGGISHNPSLQSQVTANWSELGENVGTGGTVPSIQDAFMNSLHHRENILNGDYRYVGIGVVYGTGGVIYVTVDFMTLAGAPAPVQVIPRTTTPRAPAAPRAATPAAPRAAAPVTTPSPPTTVPPPPPVTVPVGPSSAGHTDAFVQVFSELRDLDQ